MIVVDVLLALNILVLGVGILRAPTRPRSGPAEVEVTTSSRRQAEYVPGRGAVILPFPNVAQTTAMRKGMMSHPSYQRGESGEC